MTSFKKYLPYLILFITWLIISLIGNHYTDYNNNLELNIGRYKNSYFDSSILFYINNDEKIDVSKEFEVVITTTSDTYTETITFNDDSKNIYYEYKFKGELKSVTYNNKEIYLDCYKINNKFLTLLIDFSNILLVLICIIIYIIMYIIRPTK